RAFDHARPAAISAVTHRAGEFIEGQITLVRGAGKPLRGHAADAVAAVHIDLVTAAGVTAGVKNLHIHGTKSPRRVPEDSLPILNPSRKSGPHSSSPAPSVAAYTELGGCLSSLPHAPRQGWSPRGKPGRLPGFQRSRQAGPEGRHPCVHPIKQVWSLFRLSQNAAGLDLSLAPIK